MDAIGMSQQPGAGMNSRHPLLWGAILLVGCVAAASAQTHPGYDLRTEYQDSFPKYIETDHGITGLCMEILREVEQTGQLSVRPMRQGLTPWPRIQLHLMDGTIDLVVGMKRSPEREALYVFVEPPVYSVNTVVAVRSGDDIAVEGFRDLEGHEVIVPLGSATAGKLKREYPGIHVDEAGDVFSCLRKLLRGRGRLVCYHDLGVVGAIRELGIGDQIRVLPVTLDGYHHHIALSKRVPDAVAQTLASAVRELAASGRLRQIQDRYLVP